MWHESVHNGLVIQNFVGTAPVSDIVIVSQSPEIVSGGATSISDAKQRQSPLWQPQVLSIWNLSKWHNCQLSTVHHNILVIIAPLKALQCYIHPIHVVLSYFQIDKSFAYGASTHVLLLYDVSPNIPRRDGGSVSYMVGSINNGQWAVTIRACIRHLHTPTSLRWIWKIWKLCDEIQH